MSRQLTFGQNLLLIRRTEGLTQQDLADKIDGSMTSLSTLERDVCDPKLSTIIKLCKALNVQPNELIDI